MLRSGALILAVLCPASAFATAFQIEARTEAQVAEVRAWRGSDADSPSLLPRRRIVQYLGLNAFEIVPKVALGFESSVRVFADFGLPRGEANKVDGLRSEDADLLFANLMYRGTSLQFRIGRQLYTDVLDLLAFDGAWVRYVHRFGSSGFGIGAEAYTGLWVKAGSVLGSSVYQPDGIRESDLRRVRAMQAQEYAALDDIEPLVGAKLAIEAPGPISANVGFRQAWLGGKTDIRRISGDLKWIGFKGITVNAGIDYDMLISRIANARWLGRWDGDEFAVQIEYLRVSPILSADSIWMYFANAPRDGGKLRLDYYPVGLFRIYVNAVVDAYATPLNPDAVPVTAGSELPSNLAFGGGGGAALRYNSLRAAADINVKTGWGGRQIWFDLNGGYAPVLGTFSIEGRISVANIADSQNALLKGTYVGLQVFGGYQLTRASRVSVAFEANFGQATRTDTKVFVLYDLKAVL